jgi:hypothetical protein
VQDLIAQGLVKLASLFKVYHSGEVTYVRPGTPNLTCTLRVSAGQELLKSTDRQGGTKMQRVDRSYWFTAEDLILGGTLTTPQAGDQIQEVRGSVTRVFEVMAYGDEGPWRYDSSGVMIRVHTKDVGNL